MMSSKQRCFEELRASLVALDAAMGATQNAIALLEQNERKLGGNYITQASLKLTLIQHLLDLIEEHYTQATTHNEATTYEKITLPRPDSDPFLN